MAEFTVEFNVEEEVRTSDWATYRRFIEDLRNRLGVRYSHNRPVLDSQENPPTRWFHIILRTDSNAITLRIRPGNIYLDGYQIGNSGRWLEFGSDTTNPPSPHLMAGSTFLGFRGDYNDLQRYGGDMGNINLGQYQLTTAVNDLATSRDRNVRARSMIIVIQMICESIRFDRISNHLAATFRRGYIPEPWMQALERGWEDLSAELLHVDADPVHRFRFFQPNDMEIVTVEQAVAVLGILLGVCYGPSASPRFPRMRMAVDDGQCLQGRPLVEVSSVCINNIDGEDPGQLYGTITVYDGLGSQYIYNRTRDDYESIHPRGTALLTGPSRAISAFGSFTIDVALMDKDRMSPDDEVSRGKIYWNIFNTTNNYDKPLFEEVNGKYGSVTVNYIVLSNAIKAIVDITLIHGDGENPADVYGLLTARNGKFVNESVLFRKTSDNYIEVRPDYLIPLSRSVIAVPLDSFLIVRADLWDHDSLSPNDEIAKGIAKFPPKLSGTSEMNIYGQHGQIQVKVTWTLDI